jgi:hypothetical protein
MLESHRFRQALTARLLNIVTFAALTTPLVGAAVSCGGKGVVDGSGHGEGGAGGQGGATGSTASSTTSTGLPLTTKCFVWTTSDTCPSEAEAYSLLMLSCEQVPAGPGMFQGAECCYPIDNNGSCVAGRPFLVARRAVTAEVRRGGAARAWASAPELPDVTALSPADRAALASAWLADARMEHASVASFARFSLDLLAVGAPAELVAAAHAAAIDEVHHARLCFAFASAYAGATLTPEPFPFGGAVAVESDLAALAAAAVREGCVGETLAALQAAEQLAQATDPAVRAALTTIAEDEAAHAELAWRTVAWALAQGVPAVQRAVAAAFADVTAGAPAALAGASSAALAAHGRPDPAALHATLARSLRDVVGLCARSLLGETPTSLVAAALS